MGVVNIVFASTESGGLPAFRGGALASETVTSSGTAEPSINSAPIKCVVRITTDTAVYARTGPVAVAASGDWYILAGTTLDLVVNAGDVVSVIDA